MVHVVAWHSAADATIHCAILCAVQRGRRSRAAHQRRIRRIECAADGGLTACRMQCNLPPMVGGVCPDIRRPALMLRLECRHRWRLPAGRPAGGSACVSKATSAILAPPPALPEHSAAETAVCSRATWSNSSSAGRQAAPTGSAFTRRCQPSESPKHAFRRNRIVADIWGHPAIIGDSQGLRETQLTMTAALWRPPYA